MRVSPPACTFAELRTMTVVTGSPPTIAETTFPAPWAISSRLGGVMRRCGSSRSAASIESRLSIVATTPIVSPAVQTAGSNRREKSGVTSADLTSPRSRKMGRATMCSGESAPAGQTDRRTVAARAPARTATSCTGTERSNPRWSLGHAR